MNQQSTSHAIIQVLPRAVLAPSRPAPTEAYLHETLRWSTSTGTFSTGTSHKLTGRAVFPLEPVEWTPTPRMPGLPVQTLRKENEELQAQVFTNDRQVGCSKKDDKATWRRNCFRWRCRVAPYPPGSKQRDKAEGFIWRDGLWSPKHRS